MTDLERLTRLEERYAHLQRHQAEQDKVVLELSETLARMQKELATLRRQGSGASPGGEIPTDERPPHY